VRPGENVSSIARRYCITLGELFAANPDLVTNEDRRKKKYFVDGEDGAVDWVTIPPPTFGPTQSVTSGKGRCGRGLETVCDYVKLVKKVEAAYPAWTFDDVLNTLRRTAIYDDEKFQQMYGLGPARTLQPDPGGVLSAADIGVLRGLSQHGGGSIEYETGIAEDSTGRPVAIGHVLTGMSAGMHHNPAVDLGFAEFGETMDNLFATTIAGDIGQYACFMESGKAEDVAAMDATPAEFLGDVDGFLLGHELKKIPRRKAVKMKVSDVLGRYYGCDGNPDPGNKRRFEDFRGLVDEATLTDQVRRFGTNYNYGMSKIRGAKKLKSTMEPYYQASIRRFQAWLWLEENVGSIPDAIGRWSGGGGE
jgi:hypothetical protein